MNELDIFLSSYPWALPLVALWTLPWKGVALWRAATKDDPVWFIVILVANTLGILEIIYIFFASERKRKPRPHHHR